MQYSVIKSIVADLWKSTFQNKIIPVISLLIHSYIDSDKNSNMPLPFLDQKTMFPSPLFTFVAFFVYLKIHSNPVHLNTGEFLVSCWPQNTCQGLGCCRQEPPRCVVSLAGLLLLCDVELRWREWLFLNYFSLSFSIGSLWTGSSIVEL